MQFEKKTVRLGDIRPSEQNPREDFGDIGALARSIEATGGEPLNPPVVVADGNVYRIVDGSGDSCFVGPTDISDLFALARECTDTLCAAFSQAGIPDRNARREIRDMAAELGVDADI